MTMMRPLVQFEKWDANSGELPGESGKPCQEAWTALVAGARPCQGVQGRAGQRRVGFEHSTSEFRARTELACPAELQAVRQELAAHLELGSGHVEAVTGCIQSRAAHDFYRAAPSRGRWRKS